jgi:hypothetical protein
MTVSAITQSTLDAEYIERVNQAVADDRFDIVDALAREYERELLSRVRAA